jgi:hypothetical protein
MLETFHLGRINTSFKDLLERKNDVEAGLSRKISFVGC